MSSSQKPLIFLSHSSSDAPAVNYFKERLAEMAGGHLRFFLASDDRSLELGVDWAHEITKSLEQSACVLVFLTNAAAASPYVLFEAGFAQGQGRRVIPIGINLDVAGAPAVLAAVEGITIRSEHDLNRLAARL